MATGHRGTSGVLRYFRFDEWLLRGTVVGIFSTVFFQNDAITPLIVFADVQKGPHQHNPASAGSFQIFLGGGVWNVLFAETLALILNLDSHFLERDFAGDSNPLGGVHAVSMLDGVDDRFFQRQSHSEDIPGRIIQPHQ